MGSGAAGVNIAGAEDDELAAATVGIDAGVTSPKGDAPNPCRDASIRPDDSASPAANSTSAAARPVGQGRGSPHTGQIVIPSRGPDPPAWA